MIVRLPLAFIAGLLIYLIAMVMTVYDGILSLLFQPIVGSIFTSIALALLCVLGSPLLIKPIWRRWQRLWWITPMIVGLGVISLITSWMPGFRAEIWDPELNLTVETFHPALATAGWLAVMFGIAFCPLIRERDEGTLA